MENKAIKPKDKTVGLRARRTGRPAARRRKPRD